MVNFGEAMITLVLDLEITMNSLRLYNHKIEFTNNCSCMFIGEIERGWTVIRYMSTPHARQGLNTRFFADVDLAQDPQRDWNQVVGDSRVPEIQVAGSRQSSCNEGVSCPKATQGACKHV